MRKEVVIAILIGFGLGLVITFGAWTANKALKEGATKTQAPGQGAEGISLTPTSTLSLIISSPEDNSVVDKEKIEVSGKAFPQAVIAVVFPKGEKVIETDEEGNFSTEISLVGGANEITISTFDTEENEVSKTLTIVYSTAEI